VAVQHGSIQAKSNNNTVCRLTLIKAVAITIIFLEIWGLECLLMNSSGTLILSLHIAFDVVIQCSIGQNVRRLQNATTNDSLKNSFTQSTWVVHKITIRFYI